MSDFNEACQTALSNWKASGADHINGPVDSDKPLGHCFKPVAKTLHQNGPWQSIGWITQQSSGWAIQHWSGAETQRPDSETIAEVTANWSGRLHRQGRRYLVPITTTDDTPPSLLWATLDESLDRSPDHPNDLAVCQIESFARWLQTLSMAVATATENRQLRTLLSAAALWQTIDDLDDLLNAVARTATQILHCERASIFLHHSRRNILIGRPAIGVDGGVLEVPDDRGIVGEVLQSTTSQLWTRGDDRPTRQNAEVDRQTQFETHSIAAVPMRRWRIDGADPDHPPKQTDDCIGVFEAINHQSGSFDSSDLTLLEDLSLHASVAIATQRRRRKLIDTRDRLIGDARQTAKLIGDHPSIQHLRTQVERIAPTDLSVLVRGENGTGKEIVARQIHYRSTRADGPFVAVNCAAIVETLLESELFGHEKGAFTDASQTRIGKFESASGGTLFLDEIGDMTAGGQAKLLRALETRQIVRVGGTETIPIDVRIVAATNQPLETMIAKPGGGGKTFREDLFFRLAVVTLQLPPLRQRGDDIIALAEHFLTTYAPGAGRPDLTLSDDAKQTLKNFAWPGNIRQLRNVIERTCYLAAGNPITPADLDLPTPNTTTNPASSNFHPAATSDLAESTRRFQIHQIQQSIAATGGNMTAAAESLGLHRSNLYRKMRQLGMDSP